MYYAHARAKHMGNTLNLYPMEDVVVISKQMLQIKNTNSSCEIALKWVLQNIFKDKSSLVKLMDWCRQATRNYMSQCWPSFIRRYVITRQWSVDNSCMRK